TATTVPWQPMPTLCSGQLSTGPQWLQPAKSHAFCIASTPITCCYYGNHISSRLSFNRILQTITNPAAPLAAPSNPSQRKALSKLLEESHVVFDEQPDVADAVFSHRNAFDAKSECPPRVLLRIDLAGPQHVRVHHPA